MSRLLYLPTNSKDTKNPDWEKIRQGLNLTPSNEKAHLMLEKAVALNPNDYKSLYELGCDYKGARGVSSNLVKAKEYLSRATNLVKQTDDAQYKKLIKDRIENL